MLIEWCVPPACPEAFRQAVSGERWVRKLVDLCRKDNTDAALVGTTVMQLVSNWSDWYASLTASKLSSTPHCPSLSLFSPPPSSSSVPLSHTHRYEQPACAGFEKA